MRWLHLVQRLEHLTMSQLYECMAYKESVLAALQESALA